jgi:hypothetical protein
MLYALLRLWMTRSADRNLTQRRTARRKLLCAPCGFLTLKTGNMFFFSVVVRGLLLYISVFGQVRVALVIGPGSNIELIFN